MAYGITKAWLMSINIKINCVIQKQIKKAIELPFILFYYCVMLNSWFIYSDISTLYSSSLTYGNRVDIMKQRKRFIISLLLFCGLACTLFAADNLIKNGDFEDLDNQLPRHWKTDTWLSGPEQSRFTVEKTGARSGMIYVNIESTTADDAK